MSLKAVIITMIKDTEKENKFKFFECHNLGGWGGGWEVISLYGVVRMCGRIAPFSARKVYEWPYFFTDW